jgi:RND superfamily putative drug exporter
VGPRPEPGLRADEGRTLLVQATPRARTGEDEVRSPPSSVPSRPRSARTPGRAAAERPRVDRRGERGRRGGELIKAERISLPLTLVILVLAFGAVLAAVLPLVLGLTAVAGALGALPLLSHLAPMDETAATVVVLIGLAVGVDYSSRRRRCR